MANDGAGSLPAWLDAPGRIRTCDTRFRKPVLYPLSYGGRASSVDRRSYQTPALQPPALLPLSD